MVVMARVHDQIDDRITEWVERQPVFFVATAPTTEEGHVNVSPKGLDTFRVLGPHQVAYLDLTGSGIETIAHLQVDGRITVMFCAFDGPPRIVRFYGRGSFVTPDDDRWAELSGRFPPVPGARAVVVVDVDRISDACGYAVPHMDLVGPRDKLTKWADRQGDEGLAEYHATRNAESIDGLPGLRPPSP